LLETEGFVYKKLTEMSLLAKLFWGHPLAYNKITETVHWAHTKRWNNPKPSTIYIKDTETTKI